jgi:hypothetical protein
MFLGICLEIRVEDENGYDIHRYVNDELFWSVGDSAEQEELEEFRRRIKYKLNRVFQ